VPYRSTISAVPGLVGWVEERDRITLWAGSATGGVMGAVEPAGGSSTESSSPAGVRSAGSTRRTERRAAARKSAPVATDSRRTKMPEPFGTADFDRRLLHGGLPEALLAETKYPESFAEWIDGTWCGTSGLPA